MPLKIDSFVLGPFATNCYVIHDPDGEGCVIIDAGMEPDRMIEAVRALDRTPTHIVLTHAHCDHIMGLDLVRRAFPGVPVLLHADEASWLDDPALNLSMPFGSPFTTAPADQLLQGGETLELANRTWSVIHTPGHSPGGITLYCEQEGVAIVGDTLFNGSIGRFDFPTSDQRALFRSITELIYALPDDTRVFPGHNDPTTVGQEAASNPFVRRT